MKTVPFYKKTINSSKQISNTYMKHQTQTSKGNNFDHTAATTSPVTNKSNLKSHIPTSQNENFNKSKQPNTQSEYKMKHLTLGLMLSKVTAGVDSEVDILESAAEEDEEEERKRERS